MLKKIISTLIFFIISIMLVSCEEMTPEEYKKYVDEHTHTYEVISVIQYISTETNRFGGIESESLKYCFTYIGDDGKLHQVDDFEHTEHGLWKVCVGNKNKYVIDDSRIDTYKTLYLTRETFAEIQANSKSIKRSD